MGNDIVPRYEFRTFAQTFGLAAERIRSLSRCEEIRESAETYLVSRKGRNYNVKVRQRLLDIKQLVEVSGKLERWKPVAKETFPIARDFVNGTLLPALELTGVVAEHDTYTFEALIDDVGHRLLLTRRPAGRRGPCSWTR